MKKKNPGKIKYLVMDVDGTLTDGKIYMGNEGEIFKAFHVRDGYGLHTILPEKKIFPIIITGRTSEIVKMRCKELCIDRLYQGVSDKCEKLKEILPEQELAQTAYIGDDLNDISCMRCVKNAGGFVGCPADAIEAVKALADYVSTRDGGAGAVRDFIDWLVRA